MQAILLAAGESSRFWPLNTRHKSLVKIAGRPLIEYTIKSLTDSGIDEIIIVQGAKKDIEKEIGKMKNVKYVIQKEPKGMGNALLQAEGILVHDFKVLNAERHDSKDFIKKMMDKKKEKKADMVLLGGKTHEPWLYGIFKLDGDRAKGIIEKPAKGKEPSDVKAVGMYLLNKDFFEYYKKINEHTYAFEEALNNCMKEKDVFVAMAEKETLPLKYPWHLFAIRNLLFEEKLSSEISKSAKIAKSAVIEGKVHIGDNTKVFENAVIKGPVYIGNNCVIGNNALVRDYTDIGDDCVVGANCEVRGSILQDNVHTHSGFIGDSIIDRNCRIGAGFITGNVRIDRGVVKSVARGEKTDTGLKSFGCVIGENTKAGIGVKTMPGIMIGDNCMIGPSSCVRENVESGHKFYTEFKHTVKKKLGNK